MDHCSFACGVVVGVLALAVAALAYEQHHGDDDDDNDDDNDDDDDGHPVDEPERLASAAPSC